MKRNQHFLMKKRALFLFICTLLGMGSAFAQTSPVIVTTNENAPVLYAIQSVGIENNYAVGTEVTTGNSTYRVRANELQTGRRWYFLDAGTETENEVTTQYYFIINSDFSTKRGLYYTGDPNAELPIVLNKASGHLQDPSHNNINDTELNKHKFSIEAVDGHYRLKPHGASCYVNAANASTSLNVADAETGASIQWNLLRSCAEPVITQNRDGTIAITCTTDNSTIYYTTNGQDPNANGSNATQYNNTSFTVQPTMTVIKAIATNGIPSDIVERNVQCPTPYIDQITENGQTKIRIVCKNAQDQIVDGAIIRYTTNGATPTINPQDQNSFTYDNPFTTTGTTIKAIAYKPDYYAISEVGVFNTLREIQSYEDIDDMNGNYILAEGFNPGTTPIHVDNNYTFTGTIDGQMHVISGLDHPLFESLNGAIIKNVILDNVTISSGNTNGDAGAIAYTASGATRIYNCGVLATGSTSNNISSTISGSGKVGSIVGSISGNTRVVNCYSFAKVTGGTYAAGIVGYNPVSTTIGTINTNAVIMSCMFYGDIEVTANTSISPIYGGEIISNSNKKGNSNTTSYINNYNYFRYESPYIQNNLVVNGQESTRITYNCALAAKEEYLTRYEFFRYQLNSIRELTAWYATGSVQNAHSVIAKWVIDKSIADYPILKMQGTYPTVVNYDNYSTNYNSKVLGTLKVNIQMDDPTDLTIPFHHPDGAELSTTNKILNITDKDLDNFNYNYYKVQLPYYNEVGTGNYTKASDGTSRVVTGWIITNIVGGTPGTFKEENSAEGYNFADRYCTQKDLYSVSKRVFNQGAYFNVPDGVTEITIKPYWAKAVYVSDAHYDIALSYEWGPIDFTSEYLRSNGLPKHYTGGQSYTINGCESQTVYTGFNPALTALAPQTTGTVYDYAIALVGNLHLKNGDGLVGSKIENTPTVPFTIMSADLDFDNEPDYSLIYNHPSRKLVPQVRFDFLNCPGVGWVQKPEGSVGMRIFGIFEPLGWFEVTNTCVVYFDQFECASKKNVANTALILQGGVYHQITSVKDVDDPNKTSYILVGDNAKFEIFNYGCHNNSPKKTYRRPISVMGGEYDKFYLSGYYNAREDNISNNHANCFVNGGKFGEMAGAGMESLKGNVTWKIDHADIDNFYGGGINHTRNVKGNISVTINNSNVGTYCGGPKFGNMESGKTVTTNAQGCTFGKFFGAGYGGTSINRQIRIEKANKEATDNNIRYDLWPTTIYTRAYTTNTTYENSSGGTTNYNNINAIATGYDDEYFYESGGNKTRYGRFYVNYASLSLARTNNVTTSLKDCAIGDFYGGGSLGKVQGNVTSTLENCRVSGNVFGGGYSATTPTVEVYPHESYATLPLHISKLGMFKEGVPPTAVTYTWAAAPEGFTFSDNTDDPQPFDETDHLIYTNVSLSDLGQVHGNATLSLTGTTTVGGNVYGGGDASAVLGNTIVNIETAASSTINAVFGGGNVAGVKVGATNTGNTTVNIKGNSKVKNVYGGGNEAEVENMTNVNLQGGTIVENVYGAGKGLANREQTQSAPTANADVKNYTNVTMTSGTVNGSVFGGGENGSVGLATGAANDATSTVSINGGLVKGSVFAGGAFGFTKGITIANVSGNSVINTNVYGGAYGALGTIYVAGMHIVNMRGGTVYGSVYGGSYNADDGLSFTDGIVFNNDPEDNEQRHVSVVNMSGGRIHGHLFASGFFGKASGSTYAFIGQNAIIQAPHHVIPHPDPNSTYNIEPGIYTGSGPYNGQNIPGSYYNVPYYNKGIYNSEYFQDHKALIIEGNVWAGADYGELTEGGGFGASTITGRSNIYINGNGYDTSSDIDNTQPSHDDDYMNILGSVYGCGTSCDGGALQRDLFFRNYGELVANPTYNQNYDPEHPSGSPEPYLKATRNIYSFQRADELIIDDSHIQLLGQGKVTSTDATRKYSLYNFSKFVNIVNGSSLFIDYPFDEIDALGSYYCNDVYAEDVFGADAYDNYHIVNYNELNRPYYNNKIRINKGTYLKVGRTKTIENIEVFDNGQLEGFFYLMADSDNQNNAYAYARFKDESYNQNDGGFVSYAENLNTFDASGNPVTQGGVQIPYTNYDTGGSNNSKDDEPNLNGSYYRAWRYSQTNIQSNRECVLNAIAHPENQNGFSTVSVSIDLLPTETQGNRQSYYVIKNKATSGAPVADIDWGDEATLLPLGKTQYYEIDGFGELFTDWMAYENNHTDFTLPYTPTANDDNLRYLRNHPNSAFGLSAIPTGGLTSRGLLDTDNTPWLICPDAHDVLMDQQWNSYQVDGTSNTMSFMLTYSNAIDGNYAWEPIYITLQHIMPGENGGAPTVLDEIKVKITITTTTSIVQNIETKTFALMQGKGEMHDNFNSKMLLPHYTLHEVGENFSDWYLTGVEWRPNTTDGFNAATFTKVGDEYQSNNDTWNKTHFSMTMMATYNFDNSLGWFTTGEMVDLRDHTMVVSGDNLVAEFAEPIFIGNTDGRSNISLLVSMKYDGSIRLEDDDATDKVFGEVVMHLKYTNYSGGTGDDHANTIDFTVEAIRRGTSNVFFIDGVHGKMDYSGKYPDAAKASLASLLYATDEFQAGDIIYVVDKVTAKSSDGLSWNSQPFSSVDIYRYPGGHPLAPTTEKRYEDYSTEHPNNPAYLGPMVEVQTSMSVSALVLDGSYDPTGTYGYYSNEPTHNVNANSPLIEVMPGGTLSVLSGNNEQILYKTVLKHNYNANSNGNGGAILVHEGGNVRLSDNTIIKENRVDGDGGGVYLTSGANMILSDLVTVKDNMKVSSGTLTENNIYLDGYNTTANIGTQNPSDIYGALSQNSRVGFTKTDWQSGKDYMPVLYSDDENLISPLFRSNIVFDDLKQNTLEKYPEDLTNHPEYFDQKLYFVNTWVNYQFSAPSGFSASDIDTPQELAWAISLANGRLDGSVPATPSQNFTITADIDMSAHIWVPIGNGENPYTGTFNANGHIIKGLQSSLSPEHLGLIGMLGENGNVQNVIANATFEGGIPTNVGTVVGTMTGGTVDKCEALGTLNGGTNTVTMGGLVGKADGGLIVNSMSMVTLNADNDNCSSGGLVGLVGQMANLKNSFSHFTLNHTGFGPAGGLAGTVNGNIHNCYALLRSGGTYNSDYYRSFASAGNGTISHCYAKTTDYVKGSINNTNYGAFTDAARSFSYSVGKEGDGNRVNDVPLVKMLNDQCKNYDSYSEWMRTLGSPINGDYPILRYENTTTVASPDNVMLEYSNDLSAMIQRYNAKTNGGTLLVYENSDIATVNDNDVTIYVDENVALTQSTNGNLTNVYVGITMDNSDGSDLGGANYDWHMFSSPLTAAPLGINNGTTQVAYGSDPSFTLNANVDAYIPSNTPVGSFDLYSYFEEQYHWINLKRNSNSHWHDDLINGVHQPITYTNENSFTPGKGYLVAIDQETFLQSHGTLNNGEVTIPVTKSNLSESYAFMSGYNLIGNPYQSYLDFKAFAGLTDATSGLNTLLSTPSYTILDADENGYKSYAVDASTGADVASRYIHPHQGFFVVTSGSGNLTFNNNMRSLTGQGSSFRGDELPAYPLINLHAIDAEGRKEIVVVETGRPQLGGALKMKALRVADAYFYAQYDKKDYSVLFTPAGANEVPLGFEAQKSGQFTLSWDTHNEGFTYLHLVDNLTGADIDCLSENEYRFESSVSDYASRFKLVFSICEDADDDSEPFAYYNGSTWVISNEGRATLQVIDALGRVIHNEQIEGNATCNPSTVPGVYLMRLIGSDETKVQKVIVR